jgi:hypothetical protein
MTAVGAATNQARTILKDYPFRRIIVVSVTLVGLGASAGSIQLLAGVATQPVSTLNPSGQSSWTLPAGCCFLLSLSHLDWLPGSHGGPLVRPKIELGDPSVRPAHREHCLSGV